MTAPNAGPAPPAPASSRVGERGSVLLIALLMVVVFTLVGATFLTLAGTERSISTNHRGDVQALFVAESGAQLAYQSLAANNFQGFTHRSDGTPEPFATLTPIPFPGGLVYDGPGNDGLADERDDGWVVWEWAPGDSGNGLTGTGLSETVRFSVRPATPDPNDPQFVIDIEGGVGRYHERLQVRGYAEPVFNYALFSDGPLCEFTRGEDQFITGKIHANGDMYFRPWNPRTLTIDSPSITATGRMIRTTDIFGRDLFWGSTVLIKDTAGNLVEMDIGAPGTAMDSENSAWTNDDPMDGVDGALELWGGVVRDGSLGAVRVDPPPVETLEPGGWYDVRAGLRIEANGNLTDNGGNDISGGLGVAIAQKTFFNPAIGEDVTVQELDISLLNTSGYFPPNGLVYSEVPLRIVNADELAGDITIVAAHEIYTKGDFNSVNKRPAAILSKGRVWHTSDAWSDADSQTHGSTSSRQAANGTTTINAAIDFFALVVTGFWPVIETWGGSRTLRKYGSIVHLQNADMADSPDNSGISPEEVAWIRRTAYAPPKRDYQYDPSLQSLAGQPPFTLLTGRIFFWQQVGSS